MLLLLLLYECVWFAIVCFEQRRTNSGVLGIDRSIACCVRCELMVALTSVAFK